jgi:hypothetical protein
MKKFICFIVGIALALISFSASADTHVFTGSSLRVYKTSNTGYIISDPVVVYENYKIVINTDADVIYVTIGDNDYTFYVKKTESFNDSYKGVYFYCAGNLTVNIYKDHSDNRHIMISVDNSTSVFDI